MQTYLVGGAVRDSLLGIPVEEKDWVVVGATIEDMIDLGFRPVGKDFPVFLHPATHEEYALARTERKTGRGYKGFSFHTSTDITLEQDLYRRDITINAMAMAPDSGQIVDPFHGQQDLEKKLIRHVSPAFREDPLRVLRVARFAARYCHLGFKVADETLNMMREMVTSGELGFLVAERVWKELDKALGEKSPEIFIETLRQCHALQAVLPEIDAMFGIPQPAQHHPEIDTGVHSLLALQQACRLSSSKPVRFATLVHDLGKATTPKKELPRHIAHEQRSVNLIKELCQRIAAPNAYRDLALTVAQYHTHCHRAFELKSSSVLKMLTAIGAFRDHNKLSAFLICCEADAKGRTGLENTIYQQAKYLQATFDVCKKIETGPLIEQGYAGEKLGLKIQQQRIDAIGSVRQLHR